MKTKNTGEPFALRLSEKDEAIFRQYSQRTGVDFNSIIQSAICDQIEAYNDSSPFEVLPKLLNSPVSPREITAEIHPLVFDLATRAAASLGVDPVRLVALTLELDAICLASDLDQHEEDLTHRAEEAVSLNSLLSRKNPVLGYRKAAPMRIVTYDEALSLNQPAIPQARTSTLPS